MTSTTTPSTEQPVRLSITVTPEVHAAFRRLADASGMSMGKAMGDWLGDTLEAVEFMADKIEQARAAPKLVMREMHAYALGLADETGALLERVRQEGKKARTGLADSAERGEPGRAAPSSPSCNTGGKVPKGKTGPRGGKS